jgi:molecular chaperone GrpE
MKKIPTEQNERNETGASGETGASSAASPHATGAELAEAEDATASLEADLDRFRDPALRSQADFENYKVRCARKEEAIKYANSSLRREAGGDCG